MKTLIPLEWSIWLKWWFIKLLLGGLAVYCFFVTWEEVSRGKFVNAGFYQDGVSNLFLAIVLAGIPSVVIGVPLLMVLKSVMFNDEERVFEKVQELRRYDSPPQPAPLPPVGRIRGRESALSLCSKE